MRKGRGKRKYDTHHFLFPKKLYKGKGNNFKRKLAYELHHGFHDFFDRHCRNAPRVCRGCLYGWLCCYRNSPLDYGRRLK